jgi:hypothetical protein
VSLTTIIAYDLSNSCLKGQRSAILRMESSSWRLSAFCEDGATTAVFSGSSGYFVFYASIVINFDGILNDKVTNCVKLLFL